MNKTNNIIVNDDENINNNNDMINTKNRFRIKRRYLNSN